MDTRKLSYRRIRDAAFLAVTTRMRAHGIVPNPAILQRLASAAINGAARDQNVYVSPQERHAIISALVETITRNWRPEKARPPAAVSRPARAVTDEKILKAYHEGAEQRPSIRTIAAELDVSKARVQRVIAKYQPSISSAVALSSGARRALAIVMANFPADGIRAVDKKRLLDAAMIEESEADLVFQEINEQRTSTFVLSTSTKSCLGSNWVVVCRGRRKSAQYLLTWLERAERKRHAAGRNPLRPDQRTHVVELEPAAPNLVFKDLHAVRNVARGTRSITAWRNYVNVSVLNQHENELIDREAIVTVCQSFLRLSNIQLDSALSMAAKWPVHKQTRRACKELFSLTQSLMTWVNYHGDKASVLQWCEITNYRERIEKGDLPGRCLEDFEEILASPDDENWLIASFEEATIDAPGAHIDYDILGRRAVGSFSLSSDVDQGAKQGESELERGPPTFELPRSGMSLSQPEIDFPDFLKDEYSPTKSDQQSLGEYAYDHDDWDDDGEHYALSDWDDEPFHVSVEGYLLPTNED